MGNPSGEGAQDLRKYLLDRYTNSMAMFSPFHSSALMPQGRYPDGIPSPDWTAPFPGQPHPRSGAPPMPSFVRHPLHMYHIPVGHPMMPIAGPSLPIPMETRSAGPSPAKLLRSESPEGSSSIGSMSDCSSGYRTKSSSFSVQRSSTTGDDGEPYKPRSRSFGSKLSAEFRRRGAPTARSSDAGGGSRGSSPATKSGTSGISSSRDLSSPIAEPMDGEMLPEIKEEHPQDQLPPFSMLRLLAPLPPSTSAQSYTPPLLGFSPLNQFQRASTPTGLRSTAIEQGHLSTVDEAIASVMRCGVMMDQSGLERSLDSTAGTGSSTSATLASPSHSDESHSSGGSNSNSFGPSAGGQPALPTAAVCCVCEDRASGFHYGVVSCEGCKGFFRRTVQKSIEYSCHRDGQCLVNRVTRNRCQACRFQKCLAMGMTRESVRQDRNRKRKQRDEAEEAELRATAALQNLITQVVQAHNETTVYNMGNDCSVDVAEHIRVNLLSPGSAGLNSAVAFCRRLPAFDKLEPHDRDILLRFGCLEIWILRCAFALCGRQLTLHNLRATGSSGDVGLTALVDCVCRLRDALTSLHVFNEEVALLSAVSFFCPTRPGLLNARAIEDLQEPVVEGLRIQVHLRRATDQSPQNVFPKLLMKISDIRAVVVKDLENFSLMPASRDQ